jgi:hypothetical protein
LTVDYRKGDELPNVPVYWVEKRPNQADLVYNLGAGWTFTVLVGLPDEPALLTKTSGVTGAATLPNVSIVWDEGELDVLPADVYVATLVATEAATGKDMSLDFGLRIRAGILPALP